MVRFPYEKKGGGALSRTMVSFFISLMIMS